MHRYSLEHLSDPRLLQNLHTLVARDRATTAELLAHLAEVDGRKLYLPAAYPSMYAWCVGELRFSEDEACRRIQAARVAQQFPAIFAMLADGQLNLTGALLLAPYLTSANAGDLLRAAAGKRKPEIEQLLAERFPRPEALGLVVALPGPAPGQVQASGTSDSNGGPSAPARIESATPRPSLSPIAPERFALQISIGRETHELLRYAQALLGHSVPSGDLAAVFDRVLRLAVAQLERRKLGAATRPGSHRPTASPRHIPAAVRRAVWARDGGQCTFVSESGHRCPARQRLEFDHLTPVACGGQATVGGIRLRCRAHNQFAAEQRFGAGFMDEKRRHAHEAAERARAEVAELGRAAAAERVPQAATARAAAEEVIPFLRHLGFRLDEARRGAAACEAIADAPLEARLRRALSCLAPPHRKSA